MKAIRLHEYGAADQLRYEDVRKPTAGPGQVVVRMRAASVNPIDGKLASGYMRRFMPLTFPWVPGHDFAGTVDTVGEGVITLVPGQAVYGIRPTGGADAEYVAAEAAAVAPMPATLSFGEAAAVPLVALTAWQGLRADGPLQAGQTVLIHGGAGGVGAYAVQLARQLGARVIATAAAHDLAFVRSLGADEVLDYGQQHFEAVVQGVDMVFDLVGGEVQQRSYAVPKSGGYLVATSQPPSRRRGRQAWRTRADVSDAAFGRGPVLPGRSARCWYPARRCCSQLPPGAGRARLGCRHPPPAALR